MIVVANTSPICYLERIGHLDLLPRLFTKVVVPGAVALELASEGAPLPLQALISQPPAWLEVKEIIVDPDDVLARLHGGERQAIRLAEVLGAHLVILDDKAAREAAAERGLTVTGLLGVLAEAATRGWVDLPEAIERLRQTNFRASPRLLQAFLDRYS
jgi:predicted nucleic acid-binding protein